MELTMALVALTLVVIAYALSVIRSRKELAAARKDRAEIYRGCFLRGLAGILAGMAKADGSVDREEEKVANRLLAEIGLNAKDRELCDEAFKTAKTANLPMSYYASIFAPYSTKASRVLVYEILWDITAADGRLDPAEAQALREMIDWLSLEPFYYEKNEKRCEGRFIGFSEAARTAGEKIDRILRG